MKPYNWLQTNGLYEIEIITYFLLLERNTWNHETMYKSLVSERNIWYHINVFKLFVLDRNTWYPINACKNSYEKNTQKCKYNPKMNAFP